MCRLQPRRTARFSPSHLRSSLRAEAEASAWGAYKFRFMNFPRKIRREEDFQTPVPPYGRTFIFQTRCTAGLLTPREKQSFRLGTLESSYGRDRFVPINLTPAKFFSKPKLVSARSSGVDSKWLESSFKGRRKPRRVLATYRCSH